MVVSNHARFSLSFLQIMPMTFYEVIIVGLFFSLKIRHFMTRLLPRLLAVTVCCVHITACDSQSAKVTASILGSRVAACTTLDCETSFEGDAGLASTAVDSAGVLQVSGAQRTDDAVVMAADSTLTLKGYAIVPSTTTCASKEPISNMTPPAVKDVFAMGEGRWNICVAVVRDAKRVLLRSPEIIVDITAPAVSGAISVAGDNTLTPTLSWPTASDNYAAASEIVYQVRVSKNPMGTISDALIFGDYREVPVGSATVQMSDLVGGTTYYAVVIATDRAGNARMMSQTSFLTGPVGTVATPSFSVVTPPGTYRTTLDVVITTSTAGAAIYYTIDGVTTPSSATPPSALYTGPISVSATQTIEAIAIKSGYTASGILSGTFTIDTTPPPAPSIGSAASNNGVGSTIYTNSLRPAVSGTAEKNSSVSIYNDLLYLVGTTTADGSGAWTYVPGSDLRADTYTLTAKATDAAANQSLASNSVTMIIDTTAPGAFSVTGPSTPTNSQTPTVSWGTATDNSPVTYVLSVACTSNCVGNLSAGQYYPVAPAVLTDTSQVLTPMGVSTWIVQVTATDRAGNSTNASNNRYSFAIDVTSPDAPGIISASGNNVVGSTIYTNSLRPVVSGTAEKNSSVSIYNGASPFGTTTANGDGAWTYVPGSDLSDDTYTLTAKATDNASNQSLASNLVTMIVDTTPPLAPSIESAAGNNIVGSTIYTNSLRPAVSGTAEGNSSVSIYSDLLYLVGTTTADGSGAWTYMPGSDLSAGTYTLTAKATDSASNQGLVSNEITMIVDRTAPGVSPLLPGTGTFSAAFDVTVTATSLPDSTFKEFRYAQALEATVTAPADCSAGTQLSSGGVISITAATTAIAVIACDYTGNQSAAVMATYTKVPDAPTSLAGVAGTGKVTLTWSAVPEATGYNLYWNTAGSPTTASAKIANVSTGYVHADLLRGTTYYYVVTATDSSGESLVSNVASATPPAPIISTIAGNGVTGFSGDGGIGTSANINGPWGVAVDSSGNIYFADKSNNRIRKVTAATGNISTVAGSGVAGYSGDGGAATSANLNAPYGIAVGANGNIYISDYLNHRIRMVAAATGIISTVAGNGSAGFSGDGGAAISASLNYPYAVAVNTAGDLYVADYYNSRIRKISGVTGIISTVAGIGSGGSFSDGGLATSAFIGSPEAVAVDPTGNLYLSDSLAHRVRKVTASTGVITTILGNGETTWNGDGNAGTSTAINNPGGMAIDASGDLYFVNAGTLGAGTAGSHIIRKLSVSTGLVSTVAGTGSSASNGDGGAATSAAVYSPRGVAMDSSGNLYLSEESSRVRKVSGLTSLKPLPPTTLVTSPGNGVIALNWPEVTGATSYNLYWNNSGSPSKASNKISGVLSGYNDSSLTNGTNYFYVVTSVNAEGESLVSKVASATPASSPASSWVDVTVAGTGGATCAGSPEKCSYKQVSSSLSFTPWLATVDWGTATGTGATSCAGRTYNGKTGWRVPTKDELVAAYAGGVYGINTLTMTGTTWDQYQFWSSTSFSSIYAYIVGLYFGNTVTYAHKLATSALICVRDQLPEIAISAPSVASVDTYTSPSATATYTVTYTDALSITLATGDISKTMTGTANATLSSPTGTGNTRTVTLSSFSGVGTVGVSIAANTATNSLGSAGVASSSATVQVTNSTPTWVDVTTTNGTTPSTCNATPSNCTMRDPISGLKWSKKQPGGAAGGEAALPWLYNWQPAKSACSSLYYNGVSGWHLPTKQEFVDAINNGMGSAAMANWMTYSDMSRDYFWTSSNYPPWSDVAWAVVPATGALGGHSDAQYFAVSCVK